MKSAQLTWLGHGTFLLEHPNGIKILFDPWIDDNPSFPKNYDMGKIDLICVTHGHYDHIASTPKLWPQYKPQVVGIFELCNWLGQKGVENCVPMNKGGSVELLGVQITMVHADHSCGITADDGSIIYGGEAVGYVVRFSTTGALYFAGDTNVFDGMKLIKELYRPTVACLPIGNRFTMGPYEVVKAAELLRVNTLIPMHFGTFPELTGTPEQVAELLVDKEVNYLVPAVGKTLTV